MFIFSTADKLIDSLFDTNQVFSNISLNATFELITRCTMESWINVFLLWCNKSGKMNSCVANIYQNLLQQLESRGYERTGKNGK